ncbi:SPOR domain-containing protein [Portibacter marinus]|uniref:SPOR domain-containing protein n=1 Tax=Portibacter marinus TaxID=2898660 RepID=UPI001F24A25A|nr:SPOR domain-containing protein [Portibacter marinus]
MNKRLLYFLVGVAFAFHSSTLSSQDLLAIADKQYELEAYDLAIENYKKILTNHPGNTEAMYNLAESYRMQNNVTEALNWYDQLTTKENINPLAYLHYGHLLKSTGDIANAKLTYIKYMEFDMEIGQHFAESCDAAMQLMEEDDKYDVKPFAHNSNTSDFAVSFKDDMLVFNSFRTDLEGLNSRKNRSILTANANQMFAVKGDQIAMLRDDLKSSYHLGPITYGSGSDIIAYTKNNFKDGVKFVRHDDSNMSLFVAEKTKEGDFDQERPFPYNETGFSTGFASLANGGKLLYFASNRPGGFGGYDIYMSQYKEGGWSLPVNLGPNVNTPGNEISPFYSEDDNFLFFASDFRAGFGGYDNFISERVGALEFEEAINMGKGVNSLMDDYFFVISPVDGKFYFTSNRMGGAGKDDIYYATPMEGMMMADADIPGAVNLEDMEVEGTVESSENTSLASMSDPKFYLADNNFSLEDARLLAKHNLILSAPPSKVYYIQVASLSKSQANVGTFKKLTNLGNLYKVHKNSATKIRLGYYYDRNEAAKILSSVKGMGYNDAFIVHEPLLTSELELVGDSKNGNSQGNFSSTFTPASQTSNYKVRLASYTDPLWFDISRVNDLGEIEQWTKGQYTIFILSGYGSLDNAQKAMLKAKNRGFTEAHIVIDNNGYLEKLKQN